MNSITHYLQIVLHIFANNKIPRLLPLTPEYIADLHPVLEHLRNGGGTEGRECRESCVLVLLVHDFPSLYEGDVPRNRAALYGGDVPTATHASPTDPLGVGGGRLSCVVVYHHGGLLDLRFRVQRRHELVDICVGHYRLRHRCSQIGHNFSINNILLPPTPQKKV